ncbi:MAG: geranylgeranyl reductase family protein, partial [Candidatus Bathyarchaeia archaeon]
MSKGYEVVVVGAGSGGSTAAYNFAKEGFRVLLIDRKSRDKIGEKACGEAVGKHHFENLGISPPTDEEVASRILGIDIFSPDQRTVLRVKGTGLEGYILNRLAFGQRLLNDAVDMGCELLDRNVVTEPIVRNDGVVGVRCREIGRSVMKEINSKLVVDASGVDAVTRKWLLSVLDAREQVLEEDMEVCYVELREVKQINEPEYLRIYLDQSISPGGYYWIFPKGKNVVNVGLGLQMRKGFPNPKANFEEYVLTQDLLKGSVKIKGGGGIVPTRRPLCSLVGNGLLLVGDSACMPNPIHGGGIGPSMIAGKLAAEVGSQALESGSTSIGDLWEYNVRYMSAYGAKAAGLDIFRIFLQKCSNEDLNYGLANRLIKEEDILKASMGE